MSDVNTPYVTILRQIADDVGSFSVYVIAGWCRQSADEIERLRAEVERQAREINLLQETGPETKFLISGDRPWGAQQEERDHPTQYIATTKESTMIDYRELLKKYMNVVIDAEGMSYINYGYEPQFTPEEISELQKLVEESDDE